MYYNIKRILDIVFSLLLIVIFSPLFILLSIVIKINSVGPILFIQKRVGLNGHYFYIYKFRSMRSDTPNLATDKLSDPKQYITSIGLVLRKTSLDELPQLFNILKGDMSFIGPRPALYNQYELNTSRKEAGIDGIKPGLTGYAQVMGRDLISDEEKVRYDKYYLENLSFLLDVRILLLTVFKVAKADGVKIS